jgi:hypothetical protein
VALSGRAEVSLLPHTSALTHKHPYACGSAIRMAQRRLTNQQSEWRPLLRRSRMASVDGAPLPMASLRIVYRRTLNQRPLCKRAEAPVGPPRDASTLTIGMWPMAASRITLHRLTNQLSEWTHLSLPDRVRPLWPSAADGDARCRWLTHKRSAAALLGLCQFFP